MNDLTDHHKRMRKIGEEALDDWLYPHAQYGGGGFADDRECIHIQGQTSDSLEQVREYYWKKCYSDKPLGEGSTYALEGNRPWIIFRSPQEGPGGVYAGIITHITKERTISIFAMPAAKDGLLNIYITRVPHQSKWWSNP